MASWKNALARTRDKIKGSVGRAFKRGAPLDEVTLEELEETLLQADVPVRLVGDLIMTLEKSRKGRAETRQEALRTMLLETLGDAGSFRWQNGESPLTILIVGVNGSGKTTTAAKLAHLAKRSGLNPLLGAGDTFRAAGSDQLKLWADRVGCDVVAGKTGADAAAVAYDAMDAAIARKAEVLIFDTAGRMHTREPLMKELEKVRRSMSKRLERAPHQTWIVLDATIGQNALHQARQFHEASPLSGVIVAKLDGSAKAGFLFGVARELGVPILFAGLGEQEDDLVPFHAPSFVDALLGIEEPAGSPEG